MHLYEKRPKFRFRGLIVSVLVFAAVVGLVVALLSQTEKTADTEQTTLLETAVRNAAVSCYATRGYYPATLDDLVAGYGVVIDKNRFIVRYEIFGSNIMPDISVVFRGESAK